MHRLLIYGLSPLLLVPVLVRPAFAQPRHTPIPLTPSQFQQLSGALVRPSSQDFFEQGRRRLETEVKILTERKQFMSEGILKISQELRVQPNFSQFEQPKEFLR